MDTLSDDLYRMYITLDILSEWCVPLGVWLDIMCVLLRRSLSLLRRVGLGAMLLHRFDDEQEARHVVL
jgi:hypothetical protein